MHNLITRYYSKDKKTLSFEYDFTGKSCKCTNAQTIKYFASLEDIYAVQNKKKYVVY